MDNQEDYELVTQDHDRLINAISKLDKTQHINEPTRNEPTNHNSEFNLVKHVKKLDIGHLSKLFEDTAHHVQISKKLKKSKDATKILRKPLEKPQAERIKRATGYEQTKTKLGRWDPVVARSRTVDFVSFPLKTMKTKSHPTQDFLQKLTLKSPLEKELEEIDPAPKEISEEEDQVYPMTYQEMLEHRQHIAKFRAQQSYRAAKAKRQSKIKSKKYHRILKKQKLKQQLKEFEELQKTNPEEALKKLESLEKARALERHTLRHKNTGKWAKSKLVRAKYDKEVRQQLSEQLAVSRGLTEKIKDSDSSDDEAVNEAIPDIALTQDPLNPWMMKKSDSSTDEFNFSYKTYIQRKNLSHQDSDSETEPDGENQNIRHKISVNTNNGDIAQNNQMEKMNISMTKGNPAKRQIISKATVPANNTVSTSKWIVECTKNDTNINTSNKNLSGDISSVFTSFESGVAEKVEEKLIKLRRRIKNLESKKIRPVTVKEVNENEEIDNLEYLKIKRQKLRPVIDEALFETGPKIIEEESEHNFPSKILNAVPIINENIKSNIDPSKFIEIKPKYLSTALPVNNTEMDQLDDEEQVVPRVNIEEVFEEDDVVASFRQEKEDEINKDQPNDIDLSLPGWGSWGGKGIKKVTKRKRNRFILKPAPKTERRDENKGDVIIKEYKDPKLSKHKVTDVPFPFTSVKEYEASIRLPLGNTFVPEKAHRKLIKPNVITKAGAIIEPMDEEELLMPRNRNFKNEAVINLLGQK